jgi:hypothetical protein
MPTSASHSGSGRKIASPRCSPSHRWLWQGDGLPLATQNTTVEIRIVVQHFCFEAWALGNRRIVRPHPTSSRLREYKQLFDVRSRDPELLPHKLDENLNRAQFAEKYLRLALTDTFRNLTYTKSNPQAVLHDKYFAQVKNRLRDTGHIASFDDFLRAFVWGTMVGPLER